MPRPKNPSGEAQPDPTPQVPDDLTGLSDEELAGLESSLRSRYDAVRGGEIGAETLAELETIATGIESVGAENTRRAEVRTQIEAQLAEIDQRVAPPAEPEPEATTEVAESESAPEPEPQPEPASESESAPPAPQAPALAASTSTSTTNVRPIAANRITVPARQRPIPTPRRRLAITASADVPGYSAGSELEPYQVGEAFANRAEALIRAGARRGLRAPIATFATDYPSDRYLTRRDTSGNTAKVAGVIGPDALVAAGGLCAPVDASYDLAVVATADRPVRDSLARFGADRGGIRFIPPPQLADLASGVVVWTEANDTDPSDPTTKPCVTITCGTEQEVLVDAIPLCITVGNFSRRTFPEQFETWYALGLAQQARVAESRLLTLIGTASTAVTDGQNLGAARDILEALGRAAAGARNSHRMSPTAMLTVLLPAWSRDAIRADLVREAPGSSAERLATADALITSFFAAHHLSVEWYQDGETGAGQIFAVQGVGALDVWPSTVVAYMFPPGSFLHLDGGTLDLGVEIRDSALNATNDVQAFIETFESVAFTGVWSYKITLSVCVSGKASALEDLTCPLGS